MREWVAPQTFVKSFVNRGKNVIKHSLMDTPLIFIHNPKYPPQKNLPKTSMTPSHELIKKLIEKVKD